LKRRKVAVKMDELNRFVIYLELNEGYKKCCEIEDTTEIKLYVDSECMVNVQRLAKKLFSNNEAISEWSIYCER
jgi:hypothetical protein